MRDKETEGVTEREVTQNRVPSPQVWRLISLSLVLPGATSPVSVPVGPARTDGAKA